MTTRTEKRLINLSNKQARLKAEIADAARHHSRREKLQRELEQSMCQRLRLEQCLDRKSA